VVLYVSIIDEVQLYVTGFGHDFSDPVQRAFFYVDDYCCFNHLGCPLGFVVIENLAVRVV